ncbi:MAG: hypothetical protein KDC92_00720 [Bacteroidetes bacterium]|nr:hypothetical protein [Bacteroidota bacterium]
MKYALAAFLGLLLFASSCGSDETPVPNLDLTFSHEEIMKWDGTMTFNHPDNPFHKEIPDSYQVHPNSKEMIDLIKSECGPDHSITSLSTGGFATPIYMATDTTRKINVKLTLYHAPEKDLLLNVPMPIGAKSGLLSDGHMGIINIDQKCFYEFWVYDGGKAASGNAISLETDGIYKDGRSTVAAGWSQLQGTIWPKELRDGEIKHALSFAVPVTNKNGYVPPASRNDGALGNNQFAIPEGTLIRIKPDVDIDALPNIGEIEKTVYRAIQKYGMYCGDTDGAGIAIRAIALHSLPDDAYPESFVVNENNNNYFLKNFPFEHLEVLYSGEITKSETRPYVNHGCAEWE